jgi:hypothetical protein
LQMRTRATCERRALTRSLVGLMRRGPAWKRLTSSASARLAYTSARMWRCLAWLGAREIYVRCADRQGDR